MQPERRLLTARARTSPDRIDRFEGLRAACFEQGVEGGRKWAARHWTRERGVCQVGNMLAVRVLTRRTGWREGGPGCDRCTTASRSASGRTCSLRCSSYHATHVTHAEAEVGRDPRQLGDDAAQAVALDATGVAAAGRGRVRDRDAPEHATGRGGGDACAFRRGQWGRHPGRCSGTRKPTGKKVLCWHDGSGASVSNSNHITCSV